MAEELLEFENTIEDDDGRSYVAQVLGARRDDDRWVGHVRFVPVDGGPAIETDRETTQPHREALAYWARGLTYFYLEGALARARRRTAGAEGTGTPAGGAGHDRPHAYADLAALDRPRPDREPPRLEVSSPDPSIAEKLLGVAGARSGAVRELPNAGVIIYEGTGGADGTAHLFAVRFGSRNEGAVLGNWLWSRLHGAGVEVRVDGRVVELTNDALNRALLGPAG